MFSSTLHQKIALHSQHLSLCLQSLSRLPIPLFFNNMNHLPSPPFQLKTDETAMAAPG
jgi:hypothetical protein